MTTGDGTNTTFSGVVSGEGSISKSGTGSLTLSGANTYSGFTRITEGELIITGTLSDGTDVIVVTPGLLRVQANDTIKSLSGDGSVVLDGSSYTLTTGDAGDDTISGVISGSGGLTKKGAGTLSLTGINTFLDPLQLTLVF